MCGIAGILNASTRDPVSREQLESLKTSMRHRGPDASGIWTSNDGRMGLAHTRLSIIDLSPTGAQPMHSTDGRFHLVFNGEIYNYVELRQRLEANGHVFQGTSDTEVLLHLFAERGPQCLNELDGMFALGIYDSTEGALYCARDPLGEKPLYYALQAGQFAFASETRALVRASLAGSEPDIRGVAYLLRQGSIPPPFTHLRDVRFLEPAHWIRVDRDGRVDVHHRYWNIPFVRESEALRDRSEALVRVRQSLSESVRRRARADVPVAAFLSGGLDSAAVCAFLIEAGVSDLRTFTVTLPGQILDESRQARIVAQHLGTKHTEIPLELDTRGDWLEEALAAMDVPSTDGPNTWLVSRAVAQAGVKVACSGVGGDELFFGYPSFWMVPDTHKYARYLAPLEIIQASTRNLLRKVPSFSKVFRAIEGALAGGSIAALWFAKRGLLPESALRELLVESACAISDDVNPYLRIRNMGCPANLDSMRQVSFYELSVYMHDQLLRDTDCMSMAHSLEVRLPLIGKPLVETVASISADVLRQGGPKGLLRDIIRPMVPAATVSGPKRGFTLNWPELLRARTCLPKEIVPNFLKYDGYTKIHRLPMALGAVPPFFAVDALARNLSALDAYKE